VPTLEEITYDAGRHALADQEALVAGIRQRTGTLLAAHALVASFLGAATIRSQGLEPLGALALAALVVGLVVAAALLAPWQLRFAVDARDLYDELFEQASTEAEAETLGWLAAAGFGFQALREENARAHVRALRCARCADDRADDGLARGAGGRLSAWLRGHSHLSRSSLSRRRSASWKAAAAPGPHLARPSRSS
jgi:hypothetical protein